jgi:hypothetical protein
MNSVLSQIIGIENTKKDVFPMDGFVLFVIPFFIFLYFLLFPKQLFRESISILGRLIAIIIIIYYTNIHILYGILICILVIWYYQSDFLQYMLDMTNEEGFKPMTNIIVIEPEKIILDPLETKEQNTDSSVMITASKLQDAYPAQINNPITESETFFQKNNCNSKKQLIYRNIEVKHPEIVPHIFPEVSFDDKPCNPCDSICSFSINSAKLQTELELAPKLSQDQDSLSSLMEWTGILIDQSDKKEPYIGVKTINASYL